MPNTNLADNSSDSTLLIMKNKLIEALRNSSSKFFYVFQFEENWNNIHRKVYDNKEEVLKDLEVLFNTSNGTRKLNPIDIFEISPSNDFNKIGPAGYTNLSLIKNLVTDSSIDLNFSDKGYVLTHSNFNPNHITKVRVLTNTLLDETNGYGKIIYPTVGTAEEGTLAFVPKVQVYKVLNKL